VRSWSCALRDAILDLGPCRWLPVAQPCCCAPQVGPCHGARFGRAFLEGLGAWATHQRRQQQAPAAGPGCQARSRPFSAGAAGASASRQASSEPSRAAAAAASSDPGEVFPCGLGAAPPPDVGGAPPAEVSLRLERTALSDAEMAMLAEWCRARRELVAPRKLWLFDNRLGDGGAAAVAAMLRAHPGIQEVPHFGLLSSSFAPLQTAWRLCSSVWAPF
jgi:hypothetical protein